MQLLLRLIAQWTVVADQRGSTELAVCPPELTGTFPTPAVSSVGLSIAAGSHRRRDLKGAGLTGTIPTFIGDLTNLVSVQLSANALKGPLPTELGRLTALTSLTLYGNCSAITDPGSSNCAITRGVYDAGSAVGDAQDRKSVTHSPPCG